MDNLPAKIPQNGNGKKEITFIGIPQENGSIKVKKLTLEEEKALSDFIQTNDIAEASVLNNIPIKQFITFLSDSSIQRHVRNVRLRIVKSKSMTEDRIKAALSDAVAQVEKQVSADEKLSRENIAVLSLACEVVGLKRNRLDVNVRPQPSTLEHLSDDELDKMIEERMEYSKNKKNGS